MRMTQKVKAAIRKCSELGLKSTGDAETIYTRLDEAGYKWESSTKEWIERPGVDMSVKTGLVDIRIRAANGDINQFMAQFEQLLKSGNLTIIRGGDKLYPDDRHGVAVTSRVYLQVKI